LQGIKSGDQGNFRPDQGTPIAPAVLGTSGLPGNPMLPRDLEPFPSKAKGRREMLEVADAYLKIEAGQCSCERRPWTCPEIDR
jgi:hypothetical protein